MHRNFTLSLKDSITMKEADGCLLLKDCDGKGVRLESQSPSLKSMLADLTRGGLTADELVEAALHRYMDTDLARFYYLLAILEKKNWICYTLALGDEKLVTLEPISAAFRFNKSPIQGHYRLSRFACLRRLNREMVLESPLGYARIILHHGQAAAITALLAEPHTTAELSGTVTVTTPDIEAFIALLVSAGAVFTCDREGHIAEDHSLSLRQWEFHDLFFHSRSRSGRHDNALGGAFPFLNEIDPLPGVKPSMSKERIALYQPTPRELKTLQKDFFTVLESRRSLREPGEQPLTATALGLFLHQVARIQQVMPANPQQGHHYEASLRPCASGGAVHEIELYLTVVRCKGLALGFYHYDPQEHALEHLSHLGVPHKQLIADARMSMGGKEFDVLITLAARFQRTAWKYRSIAYSLIMKNVGAIYQQMYLVAAALNLAPCALGGGNSDYFASVGLDYYKEASVGEFVLSGR